MGARPLGRVIQEHIKKPLADEVLFGKLKKGGTVRITVEKKETGETGLKLESLADEAPVKPKREPEEAPKVRKAPVKKAATKKTVASSKPAAPRRPDPKGKDGGKRSLVPQLPRKN
jgi:ATP-dependent Clp protease ATP-binding subunit ClpA